MSQSFLSSVWLYLLICSLVLVLLAIPSRWPEPSTLPSASVLSTRSPMDTHTCSVPSLVQGVPACTLFPPLLSHKAFVQLPCPAHQPISWSYTPLLVYFPFSKPQEGHGTLSRKHTGAATTLTWV